MLFTKKKVIEINNLEFIDEYPNVREPLTSFDSTAIDSSELIKRLKKICKKINLSSLPGISGKTITGTSEAKPRRGSDYCK